ncbi:gliding motility-associated C-terminal domain-containing protein [Polaribacter tangerinus]|uniref:T9SS type B sorting domain-containing protein n=1 Tax=Polaribacter tangerinus TaxID=1920034 RepID=UPI00117F9F0C|nr:gliding motility-associated C-terminal domain-containing protein [Polaribacter tangerinus]
MSTLKNNFHSIYHESILLDILDYNSSLIKEKIQNNLQLSVSNGVTKSTVEYKITINKVSGFYGGISFVDEPLTLTFQNVNPENVSLLRTNIHQIVFPNGNNVRVTLGTIIDNLPLDDLTSNSLGIASAPAGIFVGTATQTSYTCDGFFINSFSGTPPTDSKDRLTTTWSSLATGGSTSQCISQMFTISNKKLNITPQRATSGGVWGSIETQNSLNITSTPVTTAYVGQEYVSPIIATSSTNNPIQFTTNGTLPNFLSLSTEGSTKGVQIGSSPIANASAVASDSNGNYYVAQFSSDGIFKITPDGTVTNWATKTQLNATVYGGAVVVDNYLYVGYRNNSLRKGGLMRYDITSANPTGEDVVPLGDAVFFNLTYNNGFIYVGDYNRGKILKVDINNNFTISDVVDVRNASGCAFDSSGTMYITSPDGKKVWKYTTSGQLIDVGITFTNFVFDVEIDAFDNIYLGFRDLGIRKYTPDFSSYETIDNSTFRSIWGISLSSTGVLSWAPTSANKAFQLQTGITIKGTPSLEDIGTYTISTKVADGVLSLDDVYTLNVYGPATITGFSDINKTVTDSNFNLTAPTSNSAGAFTYTSSDENVVKISGDEVTIIGEGVATITAKQEANGLYLETETTATITVISTFVNVSNTELPTFTSCFGSNSTEQTISVSGGSLTTDVLVNAPTGFEVSLTSGSDFSSSLNISPTSGTLSATTVYVRTNDAAASGSISGNLTISSTGVTSKTVALSATINIVPQPLSISNSLCDAAGLEWVDWKSVSASTGRGVLFGDVDVTVTHSNSGLKTTPRMYGHTTFPSEYNVPNTTTIRNDFAGTFTIGFSKPVTNPQVAFSSIGNPATPVGISTSVPYQQIWSNAAMTFTDSSNMTGREGFTIVSFPGTHSSLTFNYLADEIYCNMAFGAENPSCSNIQICEGESVTLTASGGSSYLWSPATGLDTTTGNKVVASPTVTTTYSVIDTSNSCAEPTTVLVTVNSAATAPTVVSTQSLCASNTVSDLQATLANDHTLEWYASASGGSPLQNSLPLTLGSTYYAQAVNASGCESSRVAVKVIDDISPTIITKDITVELDSLGKATISADQIDNGSSDNCKIVSRTVTPNSFTRSEIGANTVTLTVTDGYGNVSTQTATVTIKETLPPLVKTKDITVQLNISGNITIQPSDVDNGSSDLYGISDISVTPSSFNCSNVGNNTVVLSVTSISGITATKTAIVKVEDKMAPIIATKDIVVQLDINGNATIQASDVNNNSSDNCTIATTVVSPNSFTSTDVGVNTVILTVTDSQGNKATKTAMVTVEDKLKPLVVTKNINVELDADGKAVIKASDIDNGSSDNSAIQSITVSPSSFDCSNIGVNTVTLTVTDVHGNVATKTAIVEVTSNGVDTDNDGVKDNCDPDDDNDGTPDTDDAFPLDDKEDKDTDNDGIGDNSDSDIDGDGINNDKDADVDGDGILDNGEDTDGDGVNDDNDPDIDGDGINNDEDVDVNGDGILDNGTDNDGDGINDAGDTDDDNDGVLDSTDNCQFVYNPGQEDRDYDGKGDVCDTQEINISEAFTPNGDGKNDRWMIYNIENYPNNMVKVFNRWGQQIYAKKGYQNTWDGSHKGNGATAVVNGASYYYQIDLDGDGMVDYQGWIYITQ